MRHRRVLKIAFYLLVLLLALFFILKPVFRYLDRFLAESQPVNANILVIEGWLPDYALDEAVKEIGKHPYQYIVTTGLKYSERYFNLSENGYLIFYTKSKQPLSSETKPHLFEIEAAGSLGGKYSANFNFWVNDSLIGSYVANKHKEKFLARWTGPLSSVDSMMVQFTNDYKDDKHDVNLLVKDIIIDKKIVLPYMYNSEFDMSKLDGKRRMINNYSSLAELARNRLLAKGIDSSLVIAVPGRHAFVNRTLKSALAFDRWLDTTRCEIKGINVLSLGTHARRTWIIYSKLIDNRYPVGIISVDDFNFNHSVLRRFVKTVRETLGIIYYWFVLIPYAQN